MIKQTRPLTLLELIMQIDVFQGKRFRRLTGRALEIGTEGIVRHLKACHKLDVTPEPLCVKEIIDDALNGRRVFAETSDDRSAINSL